MILITMRREFFILIIFSCTCNVYSVSIGSHNCTAFEIIDGIYYCFELNSNELTFKEAQSNCTNKGGSLPVITSQKVNDLLLPIAQKSRLTWLALVQHTKPWRWAESHSEPELQGCYIRNEKDFNNPVILKNMTQDICKTYCKAEGARYAALRGGTECYCSKYFHIQDAENGNMHPCNIRCPGNASQHCGSESYSLLVLSLYGTASYWGADQPNEHLSYQSCALADADHSYWWNDVKCKETHGALCYYDAPSTADLDADDKFCKYSNLDYLVVGQTCYIFITDKVTWFKALSKCADIGAKLFEMSAKTDAILYDTLRHHMDQNYRIAGRRAQSFWISLFKREWIWNQRASERRLLYSNWEVDSPSSEKQNCSAINELGKWEDAECGRKYPFVCQFDNLTTPYTRPPTTFPPLIRHSLRPLDAEHVRREPFSFRKHGIWLILAGSLLLVFIMVFITVAYCRYCHRVKEERKKFTLYYGIDVGGSGKDGDSQDGKSQNNSGTSYLDPQAPPLTNGVNSLPSVQQNVYDSDPTYAEYGYAGTIEHNRPIKPSEKRRSKYRKSDQAM